MKFDLVCEGISFSSAEEAWAEYFPLICEAIEALDINLFLSTLRSFVGVLDIDLFFSSFRSFVLG